MQRDERAIRPAVLSPLGDENTLFPCVNAHTHLYSGLAPMGMPQPEREPKTFLEILETIWWRLDRSLDAASLRAAARLYVAEALLNGTTFVIDHHESPNFIEGSLDVIADACQELGIRALLCYGATERNGSAEEARRGLAECERFIISNRRPLVRGAVGLHASFTVSDATLEDAGDLCRTLSARLHVHVAEDEADVADARQRGYASPMTRLHAQRTLVPGSILAHGVHLKPHDLEIASTLRLWLVHNPRSNAANRVGYPDFGSFPRVALGTDGFPSDLRAEASAIAGGAAVAADRIARGRDLAIELMPDCASDEVTVEDQRVRNVMIQGRLVVRDGQLLTADIEQIRADAAAEASRLWQRMKGIR